MVYRSFRRLGNLFFFILPFYDPYNFAVANKLRWRLRAAAQQSPNMFDSVFALHLNCSVTLFINPSEVSDGSLASEKVPISALLPHKTRKNERSKISAEYSATDKD